MSPGSKEEDGESSDSDPTVVTLWCFLVAGGLGGNTAPSLSESSMPCFPLELEELVLAVRLPGASGGVEKESLLQVVLDREGSSEVLPPAKGREATATEIGPPLEGSFPELAGPLWAERQALELLRVVRADFITVE